MTDQRTPNQKLGEAIGFGFQSKAKLDALIEVLRDKGIIDAEDVLQIESRGVELAHQYEQDVKPA